MVSKKVRCIYGGYYEVIKSVAYDAPLKFKPYAQAGVKFDRDGVMLVSYESPIIRIACDTIEFYNTAPDYSRTTISHVGAFLKEYAPNISYYQVKRAYHTDLLRTWNIMGDNLVNSETGEVI